MAKDKERTSAYTLYIHEYLNAKQIAERLGVQEKTVGGWVKKGGWKDLRNASQTNTDLLITKSSELLCSLVDKRLAFEKQLADKQIIDSESYRNTIDEISKVAAMMDRMQKKDKLSLRQHIHALEKFSAFVNTNNPELFNAIIDLQKDYLGFLSEELK